MSDTSPSLYAAQEPVFPKRVSGRFRRLKWWIMALTLSIYYLTPWIRWDRGANLPDQAVLVDLANRRFYFFWIEIWPHEFYFVAGLLIMAGLGLFLFTSAFGRVWCGYTCPQTVWTDLFILVERWIEGDRNARIRLFHANWDLRKIRLRLTKWLVWILIAMATGGAWVFYFADAQTLARDLISMTAAPVAYVTIGILTATTFIFGGFMREQVCIYMCPWPRIQATMMDDTTLTVGYRDWRGEPRGKPRQKDVGDCVDCNACVAVCPMGIDIRNGQQMECITCALCIDACDSVMAKLGRDRGLIDYLALGDEPMERAGQKPRPIWKHILRPRIILYTTLWAAFGLALVYGLFIRADFDVTVSPLRNPTFVTLSDGSVRNVYELRLRNQFATPRDFDMQVSGLDGALVTAEGLSGTLLTVPADQTLKLRAYVTVPADNIAAQSHVTNIRFWIEETGSGDRTYENSSFNGKGEK
ncbi:MAG: cytochrome c oxidase accessory protein CcoG [Cognatishimia sp.]|uniref:cytochrome c oxidase accessory protein CcoG n=1 Tax=Cognatishimia sp. TaxID=2211648 RepID=UPI0040592386